MKRRHVYARKITILFAAMILTAVLTPAGGDFSLRANSYATEQTDDALPMDLKRVLILNSYE